MKWLQFQPHESQLQVGHSNKGARLLDLFVNNVERLLCMGFEPHTYENYVFVKIMTISMDYRHKIRNIGNLNPILHTWFRDSCFTCDGSHTIQVFPWISYIGMVI